MTNSVSTETSLKDTVKARYGEAAKRAVNEGTTSCCAPSCCGDTAAKDPITSNLYSAEESAEVPALAMSASLGCGNPTALASLAAGELVLDLGSGGGIDVLLSAKRVGPTGKAYGLDMTDEMLALAEENKRRSGLDQRRVPERRDREHPAARPPPWTSSDLELRDQPLERQGPRAP